MRQLISLLLVIILVHNKLYSQTQKQLDSIYDLAKVQRYNQPQKATKNFGLFAKESLLKKDTLPAIKALIEKSTTHTHNLEYGEAYEDFWKALILAEKIKKNELTSDIYLKIGWLHALCNRDNEAIGLLNKSLAQNKKLYSKKVIPATALSTNYFSFVTYYRAKKDFEMAETYIDSFSSNEKKIANKNNVNFYLQAEIANNLAYHNKTKEALLLLEKAEKYFEKQNPSYLIIINHMIGGIYLKNNNYRKAIARYNKSQALTVKHKRHLDYNLLNLNNKAEAYQKLKNYKYAFKSLQEKSKIERKIKQNLNTRKHTVFIDKQKEHKDNEYKAAISSKIVELEKDKNNIYTYLLVFIISTVLLLLYFSIYTRKLKNRHLDKISLLETSKKEEVTRKNEILELKNKELTALALQLIEKEDFLENLKNRLSDQKTSLSKESLNSIAKTIQGRTGSKWKEFEARFASVNQDFYEKLSQNYPNLTKGDRKICAFIKLEMSDKEMSELLGISTGSVQKSKYRLKKKLGLFKDDKLSAFINSL